LRLLANKGAENDTAPPVLDGGLIENKRQNGYGLVSSSSGEMLPVKLIIK
jgi:hypothetical protein